MATSEHRHVVAESTALRETLRALGTFAGIAVKTAPLDAPLPPPLFGTGTVPLYRLILRNLNGAAPCRRFLVWLQSQIRRAMRNTGRSSSEKGNA